MNGGQHNYGYNGKEENDELGLEWLDYGARNYDAALGRWMNLDPLVDKYQMTAPYAYVVNNPLVYIDPDGRDVRLSFASASAQREYDNLVNQSLGGKYIASIKQVKDANGFTNLVVLTEVKGSSGSITKSQEAFVKEYKKAVDSKEVIRQEVVQKDKNTVVGNFQTGKVDISDVLEFDKSGLGGASSAGVLIHETTEQLAKVKAGLKNGDLGNVETNKNGNKTFIDFTKPHKKGTKSENKVNRNKRSERQNFDTFKEKNGSTTK